MSSEDTSTFLKTIDTAHVVGLRDRAPISVMVFASARVSAVVGLRSKIVSRSKNARGCAA
jgi:site-specific recombinase XerD